eukprot:COSAG01_NODE_21094_length_918_cov_2.210012_1_plen_62_part_10
MAARGHRATTGIAARKPLRGLALLDLRLHAWEAVNLQMTVSQPSKKCAGGMNGLADAAVTAL